MTGSIPTPEPPDYHTATELYASHDGGEMFTCQNGAENIQSAAHAVVLEWIEREEREDGWNDIDVEVLTDAVWCIGFPERPIEDCKCGGNHSDYDDGWILMSYGSRESFPVRAFVADGCLIDVDGIK